jgi:hypothetical protein
MRTGNSTSRPPGSKSLALSLVVDAVLKIAAA